MKTIKEWYNLVKDEKLRKELLENYDEDYYMFQKSVKTLGDAINLGFSWDRKLNYWLDICTKARLNEIELLTDTKKYNYNDITIKGVKVDIYDILKAYNITDQAIGHAIKKLLRSEMEGHKTRLQDYKDSIKSIERGIELLNE